MNNKKPPPIISLIFFIICLMIPFSAFSAKRVAKIMIESAVEIRKDTPISVPLEKLPFPLSTTNFRLQYVAGSQRLTIPSQIEYTNPARLWWILPATLSAGVKQYYELVIDTPDRFPLLQIIMDDQVLEIQQNNRKVFRYHYGEQTPPENQSPLYARSAFIHPIYSPQGKVLTRIHPSDHIHHMGFWAPWTKTEFEGRHVDFWNLKKGEGTVRFVKFNKIATGAVFADVEAYQQHVDLSAPGGEKTVLNEIWHIRVWMQRDTHQQYWIWDVTFIQSCATSSPLLLLKHHYGGFGFRGTADWNEKNSDYLTSEGKTRRDGNGTRARWCNIFGITDQGPAGVLFLSHPDNYEFPEPMRIWPKGGVFFGFCPVVYKNWKMIPGKKYIRKYRLIVYDGTISAKEAEQFWKNFTGSSRVQVQLIINEEGHEYE